MNTKLLIIAALTVGISRIERVKGQLNRIENGPQVDLEAMETKSTREISNGHYTNKYSYNPVTQNNQQNYVLPQTQSFNVGYSVKFTNGLGPQKPQNHYLPHKPTQSGDIITGNIKEKVEGPKTHIPPPPYQNTQPTYNFASDTPVSFQSTPQSFLDNQNNQFNSGEDPYVLNPFLDLKKQRVTGIKPKHTRVVVTHNPTHLLEQANLSPKTQKYLENLQPKAESLKSNFGNQKSPWKSLSGNVEIFKSLEVPSNANNHNSNNKHYYQSPNLHQNSFDASSNDYFSKEDFSSTNIPPNSFNFGNKEANNEYYYDKATSFDHQSALGRSENFDYTNALEAAKHIGENQHKRNTLAKMLNPAFQQTHNENLNNYAHEYSNYKGFGSDNTFAKVPSLDNPVSIPAHPALAQHNGYQPFQKVANMQSLKNTKHFPIDTSLLRQPVLMDLHKPLHLKDDKSIPIKFDTRLIHSMGNKLLGFASPGHHSQVFGSEKNHDVSVSMSDMKQLLSAESSDPFENYKHFQEVYPQTNSKNELSYDNTDFSNLHANADFGSSHFRSPKSYGMDYDLKPPPVSQGGVKKRSYYSHSHKYH